MDIEELQQKLKELEDEKRRILAKNEELLDETKKAKRERSDLQEQVRALREKIESAEYGDETISKAEKLAAKKVAEIKAAYERKLADMQSQAESYASKLEDMQTRYAKERISHALRQAAEKAGVLPSAIDDVVLRGERLFSVSGDGSVVARDKDGKLLKVGNKVLTPEVFIEQLQDSAPHFWPASKGHGMNGASAAGGWSGKNPFAKDSLNYTAQVKLRKENPELAAQLQAQAQVD